MANDNRFEDLATYATSFMSAIGRHVQHTVCGEPTYIHFDAVEDTLHTDNVITGTCIRQFKDQNGRLYTVTITPHARGK